MRCVHGIRVDKNCIHCMNENEPTTHQLFHKAWTASAYKQGYDKSVWKQAEKLLEDGGQI